MDQSDLISVVMPVYNSENYISLAIRSILSQTYKNFELIIVDDCSTDKSLEIINQFKEKDSRIKFFCNERNMGIGYSRNIGIKNAKGSYIAMMDNDDISLETRLESEYEFLKTHNEIDICFCNFAVIDEEGFPTYLRKFPVTNKQIKSALTKYDAIPNPTVMVKSSVLNKTGLYEVEKTTGYTGDYTLWLKAGKHFNFSNINKTLYLYRVHKNSSLIKNLKKVQRDTIKIKLNAKSLYKYKFTLFDNVILIGQVVALFIIPSRLQYKLLEVIRSKPLNKEFKEEIIKYENTISK